MKAVGTGALFAVVFGVLGAIGGLLVGLGISAFDDIALGKGNAQGPMLFLITGPVGVVWGMLHGWLKGYRTSGQTAGQPKPTHK